MSNSDSIVHNLAWTVAPQQPEPIGFCGGAAYLQLAPRQGDAIG
jgi:hypothetical protein